MKLVAFWRNAIPATLTRRPGAVPRIADQIEVMARLPGSTEWIQSEQSVVVDGYGAFVVNNIVSKGVVDAIALGPILEPARGCERFEWDPATDRFRSVWARGDVSSTSMVPVVSASAASSS